LVKNEPP
jgi:hypothetical protein